jgi:hypothetical protein
MRRFARIAGIVWVVGMLAGWATLVALGTLHGRRSDVLLLFVAAAPGLLAYRWGRGVANGSGTRFARRVVKPRRPPRE